MQSRSFGVKKSTTAILASFILGTSIFLTGCSEDTERSVDTNKPKHELVYFEMLNDGGDGPNYEIAYKTNESTETKLFNSDYVVEHILKDSEQDPYVVIDDSYAHVYRQPYMIYSDHEIKGKVIDKKQTGKNDEK